MKDLKRWALLTSVAKEKQALMVFHYLEGDSSGIKEKVDVQIEEETLQSEDGMNKLLKFFEPIYKKYSLADGFEKYISFDKFRRSANTPVQEFISEWNTSYQKAVNIGCSLSDKVLAFKLLDASNLDNIQRNLVLTGVNYEKSQLKCECDHEESCNCLCTYHLASQCPTKKKEEKSPDLGLFMQTNGLTLFMADDQEISDELVLMVLGQETVLTLEDAASEETSDKIVLNDLLKLSSLPTSTSRLIAPHSSFVPLSHSRLCVGLDTVLYERSGSDCQVNSGKHHDDDSDAICCMDETKTVLTNDEREEEEVWLVESGMDELCLAAKEVTNIALIDSVCPTTVASVRWLNMFVSDMPQSSKENLKVERSSRVYKFGGGERRASKGAVTLPYGFEDYKEI